MALNELNLQILLLVFSSGGVLDGEDKSGSGEDHCHDRQDDGQELTVHLVSPHLKQTVHVLDETEKTSHHCCVIEEIILLLVELEEKYKRRSGVNIDQRGRSFQKRYLILRDVKSDESIVPQRKLQQKVKDDYPINVVEVRVKVSYLICTDDVYDKRS